MLQFSTSDIGFAIRDFIEGEHFYRFEESVDGSEMVQTNDSDCFESVDCSDSSNLEIVTSGGQRFIVRIVAA